MLSLKAGVLCCQCLPQELAVFWRNSRCLQTDRNEERNRAPALVVLYVPLGILPCLKLKFKYFVSEKIQEIFRDVDV